jgi:tRNA G18 (ribose-2'-O)-methylase SpoU
MAWRKRTTNLPSHPLLYNPHEPQRQTNAGTTVRCSVAFGTACLCLVGVGRPRFSKHGSFGSHHYLSTRAFSSWDALRQHADNQKCRVVGVCLERNEESLPVHTRPFDGPTIFVTSTKGKTLTEEQRAACHSLVHVPIMGGPAADAVFSPSGGGLTLEADVALSIVLHHFTAWSQRETHRWVGGGERGKWGFVCAS